MKKRVTVFTVVLVIVIAGFVGYSYVRERSNPVEVVWGEPVHIAEGIDVSQVRFTSDGKLMFVGNDAIFMSDADGTNTQVLFNYTNVRRVTVNPDQTKVVIDDGDDIFIANIDGSHLTPIADDPNIFEFAASFSPDGTEIAFVTIDDLNLIYGIWIMNADGTGKRNILVEDLSVLRHPRWSPDGTQITFFTISNGTPFIWIMDTDGNDKVNLTSPADFARQADWSSDGKTLVYSSRKSGDFDIWSMNSDGSDKVQITSIVGDEAKPVLSPDGQTIAFVCSDCLGTTGSELYIISGVQD
ncbi:MAG: PD40 domain-containing protein [Candidatus Heimdallarchaeota archaeon]|nr:PD40 domain-containing protein [Candidatus Heimdallarchaeota archaeon]